MSDAAADLPPAKPTLSATEAIGHIPGNDGLPWFGNTFGFLANPREFTSHRQEQFGPVVRGRFLGQPFVALAGADALQLVLTDRDHLFSSKLGWEHTIGRLFTRGLMLLDFDEHRYHRRIMQAAFRRDALEHYLASMNSVVATSLPAWCPRSRFRFYPAIKQLTLDNAAVAFLGLELGPEASVLNRAFVDAVAASLAIVRVPVPGLKLARGLSGRQRLADFFEQQIPTRRARDGTDMFTVLCHARSDSGEQFDDNEIVNHMIFLMMAAHDTLTSSITTAARSLAEYPAWQKRLREDSRAIGRAELAYDDLQALPQHDWVFNEALRMRGPVPYIPRRAVRAFDYGGYRIPANTQITVSTDAVHMSPEHWTHPERFDPERFSDARAEHRSHPFAFSPYGGGAHKCIGMHFAAMLAKVFFHHLLLNYELGLPEGYRGQTRQLPMPRPRDGLPLELTPLDL